MNVRLQKQTQSVIKSMELRSEQQLKLQEAVEGLSTVVLTYYSTGLISYLLKATHSVGYLPVTPEIAVGGAVPLVFASIAFGVHKLKKNILRSS